MASIVISGTTSVRNSESPIGQEPAGQAFRWAGRYLQVFFGLLTSPRDPKLYASTHRTRVTFKLDLDQLSEAP